MGLALLALFPQDRWTFMLAMSLFVAFCTYKMGGTTRWYFWFMAGITMPIVAVTAEHAVDAERLIPALPALRAELDARLKAIADMLSGEMTTQPTLHTDLACEVDRDQLATLPHFQQSAVLLAASHLTRLEQETLALGCGLEVMSFLGVLCKPL
jgi:hypothetical protein